MDLINKQIDERAKADYPSYTAEQKAALRTRYTPDQLAAIEAAEEVVDPRDLVTQGAYRTDPYKLPYLDDLSKIHPVIDKKPRGPEPTHDPHIRLRTPAEMTDEFANRLADRLVEMQSSGAQASDDAAIQQMVLHEMEVASDPRVMFHADDPEELLGGEDSLAPAIPKLPDQGMKFESEGEDDDPRLLRLMQQTGISREQVRRLRIKNLVSHRVVNQTRMGKIQSMYFLTIAGNQNGLLGVGEGKATESEDARRQAMVAAIRNMKPVARYEDRTIFGEVEGKVGAVELKLSSRPPGMSSGSSTHTV